MSTDTVLLDLDGTLVDSVYVHTTAWKLAFRDVGVTVASPGPLTAPAGSSQSRPLTVRSSRKIPVAWVG